MAFRTRYGSYEYFKLYNAQATLHAEMNHILRPLLDECVVVYLDDILIYSKNMKEHVEHLRKVFEILQENKFYVKLLKSGFALKKVQFLSHMVSAEGVHMDPRKIEAIKKWKPIAYLRKMLHGAELNYPIHDNKASAIVTAFKAWRCYREGANTLVYTDHCNLKYLKSQPTLSRRQVRWMDFLETHFHYDIIYKPGLHNKADALSRPGLIAGIQLDVMNPLLKGLFQHGYSLDVEIATAQK
ncbi:unnamed protein product [Closterium sp. NIES-53]